MPAIPRSLDGITPAFLSALLAERWPGAEVARVTIEGQIHGTATKARLVLDHACDVGAPTVMWLKAGWEPHSEMLGKVGIYAREPRAYAELLPDLPVRVPACYGAIHDEAAFEGVVLLEDLGPAGATLHTPTSDISVDQADAMLAMLAAMHGRTTAPEWLAARPWLQPVFHDYGAPGGYLTSISTPKALRAFFRQPRTVEYPAPAYEVDALRAALDRLGRWAHRPQPHGLLHGDAHVGNSYSDATGRPGLLDWQCARRGGWAYDVAYYLVSALSVEDRRASERDLLQIYGDRFVAAGGPVIDREQMWDDYRTCLIYGFTVWLANLTDFQPEEYNRIVSTRFAWALVDLGVI